MSKRVLVVEDQEDNVQIMDDMLSSAGYQVIKAVTGDEGVAMAESDNPDLMQHVTVNDGGQAIVGNVEHSPGGARSKKNRATTP